MRDIWAEGGDAALSGEIARGIAAAIKERWPERKVFIGSVPQGLEDGCFVICCVGSSERGLPGGRYAHKWRMEVCYFPAAGEDAMAMLEELYGCLELISLPNGECIAGQEMAAQASGGLGVFSLSCGRVVCRSEEADGGGALMQAMTCRGALV